MTCSFSSFTNSSRGVMILINNNFEFKVEGVKTDKNGNVVLFKMASAAVMLRSKCRYMDLGGKPTDYFFSLETRNYTSKVINKLIDEDIEYTKTKYVLNCQKQFYEKLYDNVNEINDDTPIENIIGENETKLSDAEAEAIEGEITYAELAKALKNMKNEKSPGLDGYTVEFFKFFWIDIGVFVLRSINYGYRTGLLSVTQKQCIITCLPKPNKCRYNLKSGDQFLC